MYYHSDQPPQNQPDPRYRQAPYPPQGGRPYGGAPNGGYRPGKRKKRGLGWQLFKFFLVLLLVAGVGAGIYVGKAYLDVVPYTSVFMTGVTVDGIDLGGMTWDEGNAAVRNQITEKLSSWYVRLRNENGTYPDITAKTLGISRDPAEALEAAWAVGHETSAADRKTIFQLQQEIVTARETDYNFSSVEYNADLSVIDTILASLEKGAYIQPQDAKLLRFNPDSTTEPFEFQNEVVGRRLNTDAIKAEILEMVNSFESGEVLLQTEALYPEIKVADLEKYYTLRGMAITPIDTSSTEARNENIRIAFSKINGYILNNGSKFSFNSVVGRRTLENGFFRAFEYVYGELELGIGGGVCQASTTVYLAAMKAGMELVSHTAHSMKVSYTDLGMDATVSDTIGAERDMSFRNNSGGQIFIAARLVTDPANKKRLRCEVRVYGVDLGNISHDFETVVVKTLQPPLDPIYIDDKEAKHVTYVDEVAPYSDATVGYVVDTYLITLDNGVKVGSEKITRSTYPARAQKFWRGIYTR